MTYTKTNQYVSYLDVLLRNKIFFFSVLHSFSGVDQCSITENLIITLYPRVTSFDTLKQSTDI